jgi:hypothetical protein
MLPLVQSIRQHPGAVIVISVVVIRLLIVVIVRVVIVVVTVVAVFSDAVYVAASIRQVSPA